MRTLASPHTRGEIVRRLTALRPDTPRRWGRMSAHQAVCHLADGFRMALGERVVGPARGPLQRTLVKWLALYGPLRWPPGIATVRELDQARAGTPPDEFHADVRALAMLMDAFAERLPSTRPPDHPIFGRMSRRGWLRWGYLHMDHHLRQFGC